jgi:hypothetical protein
MALNKQNNKKETPLPICDEIIKKTYRSLKLRHKFGSFIRRFMPLEGITHSAYRNSVKTIELHNNNLLLIKASDSNNNFLSKIKILYLMLKKSRPFFEFENSELSIINAFINDELLEYKETHKVIPNHMAYGFKYGIISVIIGLILMFIFMLYFFSPITAAIFFGIYSILLLFIRIHL